MPSLALHGLQGRPHRLPTRASTKVPGLPDREDMVGWYDPPQLLRTGIDIVVSTLFARNADRRLTDAITTRKHRCFDYTTTLVQGTEAPRREIVVDFVADTGDGWNSTYAVAYWVSRPHLALRDGSGQTHDTRRGDVLVFGGDEVYPAGSPRRYERRLVAPYAAALEWTNPPHPDLFAIPGNHDWYDNLVAFSRRFATRQWLGGWRTRQERSYFALRLPHGWWLVGSDVQLESDLDEPQVNFFRDVAREMEPQDRVILCTAEPHWVYEHERSHPRKHDKALTNVGFLEEKVFGRRIKVFLSGDQHHYRRHALPDGSVHKITAGGGGAFLHPTHGWREGALAGGFDLEHAFPAERESRLIAFRNLLFPILDWKFGVLTGSVSLLLYLTLAATLASWTGGSPRSLLASVASSIPVNAGAVLWIVVVLCGFLLFTDTSSRAYRYVGGFTHGLVQLVTAFLTACAVRHAMTRWQALPSWIAPYAAPAIQFAIGWVTGSFIMGLYLFVSLNVFHRHRNEAFSSLKIEDYKNFLRLSIDEEGNLWIYPIGITRVPRRWREVEGATKYDPKLEPAPDDAGTPPHLIEGPIRVGRGAVP